MAFINFESEQLNLKFDKIIYKLIYDRCCSDVNKDMSKRHVCVIFTEEDHQCFKPFNNWNGSCRLQKYT